MEVIPAIDIRGGKCVRLYQGDFARETVFSEDPVAMAVHWQDLGASRLHIVDLDGARLGNPVHKDVLKRLAEAVKVSFEVGGGVRSMEAVAETLALGAGRAILGTAAVEDEALVKDASQRFGERVAVSIDARVGMVATRGWTKKSRVRASVLAKRLARLGVSRIIYTDIAQDGTLAGPNFEGISEIMAASALPIIASGGVSSLDHIKRLKEMGVEGAIVGQALYTGALDLRQALVVATERGGSRPYRFDVRRMALLDDEERRRELDPEKVLSLLPLADGQHVADIGCGTGYFALPLAHRLSEGTVYALDVQPEMLEKVRQRALEAGATNIDVRPCPELDFPLAPGSLDGVLLAFVLHEMVGQRADLLSSVADLLKPGGWLAVLEWVKADTGFGPSRADRIGQDEARKMAKEAGFKTVRHRALGTKYYFLLASRSVEGGPGG